MKIQKDLATTQINTFKDAHEKAQRMEQTRFQVRTFQTKRRGASSSTIGRGDQNVPPPKFGRETGGVRILWTPRGAQNEREQQRTVSQDRPAPAPLVSCGYCGKTNHIEDTCWRKMKKCLRYGSSEHHIAACPIKTH